jgi:hypothetical protein
VSTPALSGATIGFGGDLMLKKKFGVGAEVGFPARQRDLREPERVGCGQGAERLSP